MFLKQNVRRITDTQHHNCLLTFRRYAGRMDCQVLKYI